MSVFKSQRTLWLKAPGDDLGPVANQLMQHFKDKGFEVKGARTTAGAWDVSIRQKGTFRAILGMKVALKVWIEPCPDSTLVKAGVGVFGQQAIPSAISLLVFWPVLITQVWGLVRQAKLDDEAVETVETALIRLGGVPTTPSTAPVGPSVTIGSTCGNCGSTLGRAAKFCPDCGTRV